jgi:hypothetical protein
MSLHTNLKGRLRNTSLPKSHGLMPVFEAVVNSIHSIEEKGNLDNGGAITLRLNRSSQEALNIGPKAVPPIVSFNIEDNLKHSIPITKSIKVAVVLGAYCG